MQGGVPTMGQRAGFTILEMLITVTVLAILAGILAPTLSESRASARDARRAHDLRSVQNALTQYRVAHGVYPDTGGAWFGDAPAYGAKGYQGPDAYIPGLAPAYLPSLPRDPDRAYPAGNAGYAYRSDGRDFKFMARGTPESFGPGNPWEDPARPGEAWAVFTPGARDW